MRFTLLVAWRSKARSASLAFHAGTVIRDMDEAFAACTDFDADGGASCVYSVLDQLFDD